MSGDDLKGKLFNLADIVGMSSNDAFALAAHYREQSIRLLAMAACLAGQELKADLRAAARLYEEFAEKLEAPRCSAPLQNPEPEPASIIANLSL